jgi:type IV secretion system protein VirB10
MTQNIPPNQGQQDPNNPYASQDAQDQYAGNQNQGSPYAYQQTQPNLDANAPTLTASEMQRLNKKALLFLAAIMAVLMLLAVWWFMSGGAKEEKAPKVQEEVVNVPKLPEQPPIPEEPIALENPEPLVILPPQLPPPPEEEPAPSRPQDVAPQPRGPTLAERRMANEGSSTSGAPSGTTADPTLSALLAYQNQAGGANAAGGENKSESAAATRAQFLANADSLLVRGTYIRCVLETKIITDLPGYTSCVITEPVYSINGKTLLLPKGSKMLGSYNVDDPKFPRVSVIWDRITTPNGIDVTMASPGVDNLGAAGHPGKLNSHWPSKLSSALLISLISDAFKYFGEKEGPQTQTVTTGGEVITQPYESNTAKTVQKFADNVVERNLSRPATVTINQGVVINIYVAKDVSFANVVGR